MGLPANSGCVLSCGVVFIEELAYSGVIGFRGVAGKRLNATPVVKDRASAIAHILFENGVKKIN